MDHKFIDCICEIVVGDFLIRGTTEKNPTKKRLIKYEKST